MMQMIDLYHKNETKVDSQVAAFAERKVKLLVRPCVSAFTVTYPVFHVISHSLFRPMSYRTGVK